MVTASPKIYNVDRYILATELLLPDAASHGAGPYPAMILLQGYQQTTDQPYLRRLAEALVTAGIAVATFDPSGIGASEGTLEDDYRISYWLNDVDTIWQYLFHHEQIDATRIGVWGYELGGMIAVIAAAENSRITPVSIVMAPTRFAVLEDAAKQASEVFVRDAKKHTGLTMVAALKQPLQVIIGGKGTIVPPDDTRRYTEAVNDADHPATVVEVADLGDDGITSDKVQAQITEAVISFVQAAHQST